MDALLAQVVPFLLVLMRVSGVFVFAPLLSSTMIPGKVRIILALGITAAVYPTLPPSALVVRAAALDVYSLAIAVGMEVLLGVVIGLIAMLPVVAVQLASTLIGQQMGFGLAQVYNPALETESDPIGELLLHLALGAFIFMGGLEGVFLCVSNTFSHVPAGYVTVESVPARVVVGAMSGGLEVAIRVSAPVLGILMIETIGTAFLMKTMPQLNIMSVGFATKIVLGFLTLLLASKAIELAVSGHIHEVGRALLRWSAG